MNQYMVIQHLDPEKITGSGTMNVATIITTSTDEHAIELVKEKYNIDDLTIDFSDNWHVENKRFSLVKLVKPPV